MKKLTQEEWAFLEAKEGEICLAAVKQYRLALQYVEEQTHEICMAAVKKDGLALEKEKEGDK